MMREVGLVQVGAADRGEALPFDGAEELGLGGKAHPQARRGRWFRRRPGRGSPCRSASAPVNNSFLVAEKLAFKEVSGMAPQFTAMNGLSQRALHSCTARAASSLPVPDSPNTTTQPVAPARAMSSNTAHGRRISDDVEAARP